MNTYKITNITNKVGKRDPKFNSVVNIEYVDNRTRKKIQLNAGQEVFLTVQSLPLSVHRLRIKKLIEINEVSPTELKKTIEKTKPASKSKPVAKKKLAVKKPVEVEETKTTAKKTTSTAKKSTGSKKTTE